MNTIDLERAVQRLVSALNDCERAAHAAKGHTFPPDVVHSKPRRKYIAIDVGTSGAYLVDRATGDIYNIKSYGVVDLRKHLGNVLTADPATVHRLRWNPLR